MAREGQCFSSTTETVKVSSDEYTVIDDVKGILIQTICIYMFPNSQQFIKFSNGFFSGGRSAEGKPYVFSDGIGKISAALRDDVCTALKDVLKGRTPSAFQVSGGHK